jgi:hypothetical protein
MLCLFLVFIMTSIGYTELNSDPKKDKKTESTDTEKDNRFIKSAVDSSLWDTIVPTLEVTHDAGGSDGQVTVEVEDPDQLTGHDYQVRFQWSASGAVRKNA